MPNPFEQFGFDEDGSAGTTATGNPFEQFGFEESAEPEAVTEEAPEEAGYLDQLRGGYFELRKSLAANSAVNRAKDAVGVEKGKTELLADGTPVPKSRYRQFDPAMLASEKEKQEFAQNKTTLAEGDVATAREFGEKAEKIPFSNETLDFLDESRGVPAGEAFKKAPFKIIAEIGLRSGVNSVPSLVAGAVGGAIGGVPGAMAGAGAASARLEYVNSLIDGLQQKGVDVLNVDALKEAVDNPELMKEVEDRALKRGAAIGAFDAATFGVAGTALTPFKNTALRVGGNLVAQGAVQAAGGAAGEKAAQLATGERDDRAVYAEAAGELVTAPIDVAVAAKTIAKGEPAAEESPLADSEAAQARAREAAAAAGADPLEQELAAAQVQAEATAKLADELNRKASVDKAMARIAELTAEMEQAETPAGQDAIQQAEQRIQEELQGGEAARTAGFEQAGAAQVTERAAGFERAEAAVAQQREAEVTAAEVQKQEQLASQPLAEPVPQRPLDRATTSLAEAAPGVFKTLQERRAAAAQVPAASTPTPAALPKTLAERRAVEAAKKQQPPAAPPAAAVTPAPKPKPTPAPKAAAAATPPAQAAEPVLDRMPKALRNKPKVQEAPKPAAQAQPVVEQEAVIEEDETGEVRARNESVEILAQENQGFLQVKRADAKPGAKGKGRGVALYERLAQQAQAKGLTLASDFSVSPDAVEVYRALERRGFEVTRNPATVNSETKNLVSADPRKPVFEVRPKKRGIGARNAAKVAAPATLTERRSVDSKVAELPKARQEKVAARAAELAAEENSRSVKEQTDAQYKQDLPSRGGLTSMPIERTRTATKADKATFDQEMLARAKTGEIELIPHDDVKQLTPEQRANAIQDPENKNRVYSHWRPTKAKFRNDASGSAVSDEKTTAAFQEINRLLAGSSKAEPVGLFDLLSAIIAKLPARDPYSILAAKIKSLALSDVKVAFDPTTPAEGWYLALPEPTITGRLETVARIGMNPKRFNNDANARAILHTLLHEATHAATTGVLDNNADLRREITKLAVQTRTLARTQGLSILDKNGREHYGIREDDATEFVAEAFTNAAFQDLLRKIKVSKVENVFQKFVRLVKEALGLSARMPSTMFEAVIAKTDQLFTGEPTSVPGMDFREGEAAPQGWGTAEPGETPRGLTVEQIKQQMKEFFAEYGENAVTVVESVDDLPTDIRNSVGLVYHQSTARGIHVVGTGEIYIIANNHNENTVSPLQSAVHEFIAHKGLRAFLGTKREKIFRDVFESATDRKWIKDYARRNGWDLRDPNYQIKTADEYIAYLSENLDFDQPLLQRIFDAMRALLRQVGLVRKYTDNDLRRLLRMSRANARSIARANEQARPNVFGPELQFATDFRTPVEDRNPLGSINGIGLTMEDQANYAPGVVTSRWNALKDFGQNNIQGLLALIPRRNLVDFLANGKLPAMRKYLSIAEKMDGRRNELMAQTEPLANRWVKYTRKNKKNARILAELMNASTLAGVDPLESYRSSLEGKTRPSAEQRSLEAQRKAAYDALKKYSDRLDPEAKAIYREVRDSYAADRAKIMAGIEERINAAAADDQVKRTLLNEIRKTFESGKVAGPYFPLARFGKHWAVSKTGAGDVVSFVRSDSPSEILAWRVQMREAGFQTDGGEQMVNSSDLVRQVDPNFAAKVTELVKEMDQELADQIWQMYLQSLPETSLRKQFVHRQGRLGFTADALRAFGHIKFHAAHQIAKLEFMHRMESELQQMQVEARTLEEDGDSEAKWAAPLVKEMDARHQWARNPENSSWANNLTALGFAYYLGVTPAAALVNLAQTPMVAYPTIAAEYGWAKTGKALLQSSAQWASSWGPLANRLRGEERAAFDEALRVGLFSQTRTADLAGLGQQGEDIGSARQTFMKVISWAFQFTEQANREITFLAAYRLAKDAGLSQEAAIEQGRKLTDDSHFQYQNTNRPRVMQGDAKKVLFLFRQHSTNMTYRLARDFRNSTTLQELPAGERGKAIQRLAGLLMMTFLNAGLSGMPLLWLGYIVVGAMAGDEDEPYDAKAALRAWLEEQGGEDWASRIMDGTVASAADVTLSTRVGLGNMWLQDKPDNLSVGEEFGWWAGQALGPIGGMVQSGITAGKTDIETYGDRAVEQIAPKAARDVLQTIRFAREGVTNKRGDVLVSKDELSSYDLFVKSLGFQPLQITQQYGKNRAIKEEEKTIQNRRITLMNRLFLAAQTGDQKTVRETVASMQKFNKANPRAAIDAPSLISSARSRARYSQEAINGITVQKDYRYLHEKYGNRRRPKETEE